MTSDLKNRVRARIGAMGDDEFERFMCELLPKVDSNFETLEPTYNFIGKTTKGKCDAHAYHSSTDTYTAIICTTQQTDCRKKVLDDIAKLGSTRLSAKIRHVLLCVNTPLRDEVEEYRLACRSHSWELDPFSLERLTREVLGQPELLRSHFGESIAEPDDNSNSFQRFDCGSRVKIARTDLSLRPSLLIEKIGFPSEREWMAIEAADVEAPEHIIKALSDLTGVSSDWLKHDAGQKYHVETIYDYETEKPTAVASLAPIKSFLLIEPKEMELALVVRLSEFKWKVYGFGFNIRFWEWVDDHHYIPRIFRLLATINNELRRPDGRIVAPKVMRDLMAGNVHPASCIEGAGGNSYWFDDLFDLYHRFPIARGGYKHHGEWFVKLQSAFRAEIPDDSMPPARGYADV